MCSDCLEQMPQPRTRRREREDGSFDAWAILRDVTAIELLNAFDPDQAALPFPELVDRTIASDFPRPFSCEE